MRQFTEEHKRNIAEGRKGKGSSLKGRPQTEEWKEKIVESRKKDGKPWFSEETKQKIGESRKGKFHSEETKEKIREAQRNHVPSEETKNKIRQQNLGQVRLTKRNKFLTLSRNTVEEAVKTSKTFAEVARKLRPEDVQFEDNAADFLKPYCEVNNIDLTPLGRIEYVMENPNLFVRDSVRDRTSLKKLLIENGLVENKCIKCNNPPIWQNKSLVLYLDHKDGDTFNNLKENLQLVCPNCDSQSEFYKGRNIGRYSK